MKSGDWDCQLLCLWLLSQPLQLHLQPWTAWPASVVAHPPFLSLLTFLAGELWLPAPWAWRCLPSSQPLHLLPPQASSMPKALTSPPLPQGPGSCQRLEVLPLCPLPNRVPLPLKATFWRTERRLMSVGPPHQPENAIQRRKHGCPLHAPHCKSATSLAFCDRSFLRLGLGKRPRSWDKLNLEDKEVAKGLRCALVWGCAQVYYQHISSHWCQCHPLYKIWLGEDFTLAMNTVSHWWRSRKSRSSSDARLSNNAPLNLRWMGSSGSCSSLPILWCFLPALCLAFWRWEPRSPRCCRLSPPDVLCLSRPYDEFATGGFRDGGGPFGSGGFLSFEPGRGLWVVSTTSSSSESSSNFSSVSESTSLSTLSLLLFAWSSKGRCWFASFSSAEPASRRAPPWLASQQPQGDPSGLLQLPRSLECQRWGSSDSGPGGWPRGPNRRPSGATRSTTTCLSAPVLGSPTRSTLNTTCHRPVLGTDDTCYRSSTNLSSTKRAESVKWISTQLSNRKHIIFISN